MAEARLKASNPDVLKAAHTLLGGRTLKQEANWADTHRRSKAGKATASWHFANMNLKSYPDTAGECKWEPGDDANAVCKHSSHICYACVRASTCVLQQRLWSW